MTNAKTTKRALLSSIVSLILCFTMLLSTTYAWFTDTVKSANNIITAGNLDIALYHQDKGTEGQSKEVEPTTKLFDDIALWEPGAVVWENLTVANEGTLALKYQLAINIFNNNKVNGKSLAEVLKVAVVPGGFNGTREQAEQLDYNYSLSSSFALNGKLLANTNDVYGIVIYWEPTNHDNDYNVSGNLSIEMGVNLFATQVTEESDSFDNNYDVDAWEETKPDIVTEAVGVNADGSASVEVNNAPSTTVAKTTIDAPAGAFEPTDKVEVSVATTNSLFDVTATGSVVASLDIDMKVNGEPTSADLVGKYFKVTTYISKGLNKETIVVKYVGDPAKDQPRNVEYDPDTGMLTFETNHFSDYDVYGAALAYDAKNDTALTTPKAVIDAAKEEGSVVIIPDANKQAIDDYIEKELTDKEDKEAAQNAVNNTKVGKVVSTAKELQAAIDADEASIIFGTDIKGDVTVPQKENVKITIDGNGYEFDGVILVDGKSATYTTAGLTIKNVNFVAKSISADACIQLGNGTNATRYTCNVTVDNCTFDVPGAVGVKSYTGGDKNLVITGCTATANAHSLVQAKGIDDVLVEKCTVNSKNGLNFNNSTNVTVDSCTVDVKGYAVRFGESSGGSGAAETYTITNCFLKSACDDGDAVIVLRGTADYATLTIDAKTTIEGDIAIDNSAVDAEVNYDKYADFTVVSTADDLVEALENGKDVVFLNNIKINPANMSNAYGKTGINVKKGQTIDGNGYTLDIKGAGGTWDSGINTTGGIIKNIKVTGSFRGIFINHNSEHSEKVVLENVVIDGTTYTISCDQGKYQGIEATNCTFNGWTSFAKTAGEAKFVNCSFGEGRGYKYCRPYSNTEFVNCTFCEGYAVDTTQATVTFTDCVKP